MTSPHIDILPDKPALVQRALELTVEQIQAAIAEQGRCTLALAGGSTPEPLYAALAEQDLPWDKLFIFWGDERYVPVDHPDSNAGMAKRALLDKVPIPVEQIIVAPTGGGDLQVDAEAYERSIRAAFGDYEGFPQFDLILLGMGDDGHTASLFPHTEALQVCDRLIAVGNKDGQPRLTFTVPLINQAKRVIFLVAGANKQTALAQVFAAEADPNQYPSRYIRAAEIWWLLDAEAGKQLSD
ncbi:6-phosphogluconolactonase [filamentous cyanobacterium CCP5]|nr:6-phosphogluconolactonase [filamentous cyanobacterium CCP5]